MKLLSKIRHTIDQQIAVMLYKPLIVPNIDYGDVIYHYLNQKDSKMLQRLQNMRLKTMWM